MMIWKKPQRIVSLNAVLYLEVIAETQITVLMCVYILHRIKAHYMQEATSLSQCRRLLLALYAHTLAPIMSLNSKLSCSFGILFIGIAD